MPHSLRARLGGLRYKGLITDKDYKRLCNDLDLEKSLPDIMDKIENYSLSDDEKIDMDEDSIKWGMKIAYDLIDSNIQTYLIKDENIKKGD